MDYIFELFFLPQDWLKKQNWVDFFSTSSFFRKMMNGYLCISIGKSGQNKDPNLHIFQEKITRSRCAQEKEENGCLCSKRAKFSFFEFLSKIGIAIRIMDTEAYPIKLRSTNGW